MSFPNSPGVYDRIVDQSFTVNESGVVSGGIVITSDRGPTELNIVTSAKEFLDEYGVPDSDNPSKWAALRFLQRASVLSIVRVVNDAVVADAYLQADDGSVDPDEDGTNDHLAVYAQNPGEWGNSVVVTMDDAIAATEGAGTFEVIVSFDGNEVERFICSRDVNAKNGFGANLYIENVINGNSRFITVEDYPDQTDPYDYTAVITLTGGANDTAPVTSGEIISGWDEFLNPEAVPATLLINAGFALEAVQSKMLAVAASRKVSVALLDVPQIDSDDVAAMITYRNDTLGANSYYGGLYGGWLRIYDQYGDREVQIPASGDVAGVFANTVEVGERWDAPAGLQRGVIPNALGVTKVFTEGERDLLYAAGINPVTSHAGANAIVWGQKTLQVQSSALDRFNVVNSLLWMNNRMKEALQPFVFQNNTKFTRDSVNFLLASFLEGIKQRGGLYDYSVDTSEDINTPQVIDNNQMLVDVYVKPVRAAEFVRLSVIVTPTGVSFA